MTKLSESLLRSVCLAALVGGTGFCLPVVSLLAPAAYAQEDDEGSRRRTRRTQALNADIYEELQEAQEAYELGETEKAKSKAEDLLESRRAGDYERALILQQLASWAYAEDRPNDAIAYFGRVLEQEEAPETFLDQATYALAQIYFTVEEYQKSIDLMTDYLQTLEAPSLTPLTFISQAYYQLENYQQAINYMERVIELAREQGEEIKENWYGILRASYFNLENYEKVKEITEILVVNFGKPEYWRSLAGIYGELGLEQRQLAALEVAYQQGFYDSESQYIQIAQYYLYHNVPIKAAWALEKGFKDGALEQTADNLELLGRAYLLAQEYDEAVEHLTAAAAKADDGELWLQAGQALAEKSEWGRAIEVLEEALEAGDLGGQTGSTRMLLGQAYMQQYRFDDAERVFKAVRDRDLRDTARKWLTYIGKERDRVAYLDKHLGTNYLEEGRK